MLFNSISYLIFFPAVLLSYWRSSPSWRKPLLLLSSYCFYMSWLPVYGLLIACLTLVNYLIALVIHRNRENSRPLFVLGIVFNLGTLCYYKYANFLLSSIEPLVTQLSPWLGHGQVKFAPLDIILPLGISFFAFEFIHYLTDVYKGGPPIKSLIDFGLFAAFFPSQIAGPIKRYQDFMLQLVKPIVFNRQLFEQGLVLLLQGLFKKVAIADNLSALVNIGFAHSSTLGTSDAWIASLAFALQIYFDFSGYTDMGRGSAKMLGFSLPDNFNFPYLSSSLSDFWRRWHISLSTWLRDYLYIPLGGGRCSNFRKDCNLLTTMLLGGLWHGAAWHFVAWGAIHGVALVANHKYDAIVSQSTFLQRWHGSLAGRILAVVITFFLVLVAWIFFRADSLPEAQQILASMFSFKPSSILWQLASQSPVGVALVLYGIYAGLYSLPNWHPYPILQKFPQVRLLGLPARTIFYLSTFACAIGFCPIAPSPFIYFQF